MLHIPQSSGVGLKPACLPPDAPQPYASGIGSLPVKRTNQSGVRTLPVPAPSGPRPRRPEHQNLHHTSKRNREDGGPGKT